jgi:stage IV sporulation protein FB
MVGISLSVHPLFFAFGFYYALTGKIAIFLIYSITAVVHELGHSFVAGKLGYKLDKITLMPFGAVVKGDIDGLKVKDEILVAFAGPFINLAIGVFTVALWWMFPELYAFTDVVAEANFSMALINFIPVFPLDGGRIIGAILTDRFGEDKADRISKVCGVVFFVLLTGLFVLSLFVSPNPSIMLFALFILLGAFGRAKNNKYVRVYSSYFTDRLKRGARINRIAVDKSITLKKVIELLDERELNELVVFDGDEQIGVVGPKKLQTVLEKGDIYASIRKFV